MYDNKLDASITNFEGAHHKCHLQIQREFVEQNTHILPVGFEFTGETSTFRVMDPFKGQPWLGSLLGFVYSVQMFTDCTKVILNHHI